MITIAPFKALRPEPALAKQVASKPYDVLSSKEAKVEAQGNPASFLHITKSEIDLPETTDPYSAAVYEKAKQNLDAFISRNILFTENKPCFYIYQLEMNKHEQTGLVCCSFIEDYERGFIKIHEYTRPDKELDRITHIKTTRAQTGNVFLAYRDNEEVNSILKDWMKERTPIYNFIADDNVRHTVWAVNDEATINKIKDLFLVHIPCTYIADGHHRAASAAKVKPLIEGHDAQYFLTTLFPAKQLKIMDYNRVVKDLNGFSKEVLLSRVAKNFVVEKSDKAVSPEAPHIFGMYLDSEWYKLTAKPECFNENDPIGVLDITILQNNILEPMLGIRDQRTDKRIDFVGGIRGLEELERRVKSGDMAVAFSLYPVSIEQLFNIADTGNVMPPKSTWFEPKLRDGLLTHTI
jgi:uncharacterized protein (DUF1015 family)